MQDAPDVDRAAVVRGQQHQLRRAVPPAREKRAGCFTMADGHWVAFYHSKSRERDRDSGSAPRDDVLGELRQRERERWRDIWACCMAALYACVSSTHRVTTERETGRDRHRDVKTERGREAAHRVTTVCLRQMRDVETETETEREI